ncbi:hypothetical protein BGW80DRAFT_1255789 [Lactifluus volemus]|nr:hypothetical protein BGW80DRAFT_1255789 [Lactifluus volemus]
MYKLTWILFAFISLVLSVLTSPAPFHEADVFDPWEPASAVVPDLGNLDWTYVNRSKRCPRPLQLMELNPNCLRIHPLFQMFGPAGAEQYITRLLRGFDYQSPPPLEWPGAFFTTIPIPSIHIDGRPAWLLYYQIRSSSAVVPQYNPPDARRYTNPMFYMPIFFVQNNRVDLGLNLIQAVVDRFQGPNISPRYEKLAKRVANAVYLTYNIEEVARLSGRDPAWRVGDNNGIRKEDVNLIRLVQVAEGG